SAADQLEIRSVERLQGRLFGGFGGPQDKTETGLGAEPGLEQVGQRDEVAYSPALEFAIAAARDHDDIRWRHGPLRQGRDVFETGARRRLRLHRPIRAEHQQIGQPDIFVDIFAPGVRPREVEHAAILEAQPHLGPAQQADDAVAFATLVQVYCHVVPRGHDLGDY